MSFLKRSNSNLNTQQKKNIVRYGPNGNQEKVPRPPKKASFVSLLTGMGNNEPTYLNQFDNGVDPLGRLSTATDPAPPSPPSPISSPKIEAKKPTVQLHWTEQYFPLKRLPENSKSPPAELLAKAKYFLEQHDPSSVDRSLHLALYAQENGEPDLNARLFKQFGSGLPVRLPGTHRPRDGPVPKTLRELLRAFMKENDPGFLELEGEKGLDDMLIQASEHGMDALESELLRRYGVNLSGKVATPEERGMMAVSPYSERDSNSSFDQMSKAAQPIVGDSQISTKSAGPPPVSGNGLGGKKINREPSGKPKTFVELDVDEEDGRASSPLFSPISRNVPSHNFFDDKSLRADLRAFYEKHDERKMHPDKLGPIVQWAYKIGPSELNRRFEEKYGESLNQFIEDRKHGRPGVPPGPKMAQKDIDKKRKDEKKQKQTANGIPENSEEREEMEYVAACNDYHEAVPIKGFGVCVCGLSRVDHRSVKSLLVPGPEEPHFNRIKPKIVMSNNNAKVSSTAASSASKPSTSKPAPNVRSNKATPLQRSTIKEEGKDGPCPNYRLDLAGQNFGVCKCGWPKPDHQRVQSQRIAWAKN